ncbi:MAG: molybdate ABC transporter substrate-binding protein [Pseudomonadales bacterium]|nr:molybdate ABC transporter substrate-binding protein [Pseudomonadales bacterium]
MLLAGMLLLSAPQSRADTLTVAVAANFAETLETLVAQFEKTSPHRVRLVRGSSGRHFAQIVNGAPFELFFSADASRPAELVARLGLPADRLRTYARGRLVLWGPGQGSAEQVEQSLRDGTFKTLAIANPRLAPYGQAAVETLQALGLGDLLENGTGRVVRGENVAQTYQYVATGNAELGFVAQSQVLAAGNSAWWLVPESLYQPIIQQLVVLQDSPAGRELLDFLATPQAAAQIEAAGYGLP